MVIRGVNEDHPNDFNPYYRYMQRNKSKTAAVNWTNIPAWYKDRDYRSPDIKNIVQKFLIRRYFYVLPTLILDKNKLNYII